MVNNYSRNVIEVETIFTRRGGENISKTQKEVESLGRGVTKTTTEMTKYDKKSGEVITTTERTSRGFQKFQMEQLGVMFAGMALNRSMANLNATSREWLGIGELTSTMMGVTMLDANMDLLNLGIIPLFDALTSLSPEAQKAIGITSLALEGLGGVMMTGGQFALGINSMITLLQKMGTNASASSGALKLLTVSISAFGIAIAGVAFGAWVNGLAEASEAYDALGKDINSVTEALSEQGQMTRQTIPEVSTELQGQFGKITPESLGITGPFAEPTGLRPVTDFGPALEPLTRAPEERSGFGRFIDFFTGGSSSTGVQGSGSQGQVINVNTTNNVNVSDKKEFEKMLKTSNETMVREIRRDSRV